MTAALDELPVEQRLLAKRENGVGHIIFNNPAKRNAVSLDMWERLTALLNDYAADPDLKVLVISGAGGKAFVSGADISKFESQRSSKEAVAHYSVTGAKGYEAVYNFPKPTIAKIQGYCIGGGCNLAVCCDIRVATEDARFGIPAAKLGLGYGYTAVRRLAEIIGVSNAMEIFFTAKQISAAHALAMGLVNQVVSADKLDAAVDEMTRQIAENAPLTIAAIKASARELGKPEAARDLARLDRMVDACFTSDDYVEGRRAFMEKRKPLFKGR